VGSHGGPLVTLPRHQGEEVGSHGGRWPLCLGSEAHLPFEVLSSDSPALEALDTNLGHAKERPAGWVAVW
jgi:hypothetical protein